MLFRFCGNLDAGGCIALSCLLSTCLLEEDHCLGCFRTVLRQS